MKNLLDNDYVAAIGKKIGTVIVAAKSYTNSFSLVDPTSCNVCAYFFKMGCDGKTLLVDANGKAVTVLDHEAFMNNCGTNTGGNCDYIIYDDSKVAFVDLYCGLEQFLYDHTVDGAMVKGKRKKVREQAENSIRRLYSVPSIAAYLDSVPDKLGVIGYRVKDDDIYPPLPVTISKSEQMMMQMARELETRHLSSPMSHDFRFLQIKYPQPLKW